jgi:serine phosphatase RsbU (regulator of sigma subunit)
LAAATAGAPGSASGRGEDSDVTAALIRTAFIIAFIATRYMTGMSQYVPRAMDFLLVIAAIYNVLLLWSYLRRRSLPGQRLIALMFDLLLVTGAIATFGGSGRFAETSRDLFGLYYLVVITAAIWFKRSGAIISATVAIILAALIPWLNTGALDLQALVMSGAKAPLLLLVAVVAGYLVRARDAEHQAAVELRQEMRLARALQRAMLPAELPAVPGYDIGLTFQPARLVGGDFYGVRLLDEDRLLVVLADMAGKSVYGLVHLSLVHSHLQAAADSGASPAQIAAEVNRHTYAALQPESYAAVFVGILRLSDGLLTFANCGHVPPLRIPVGAGEGMEELATQGIVIGAMRDPEYAEKSVQLRPGDLVICYSDGLSEARNRKREEFGEARVGRVAADHVTASAQEVVDRVLAEARGFAPVGQDDATVLVVRRVGGGGGDA